MNVDRGKSDRERVPTKFDTNRLEAGSFITDKNGNRIPNMKDPAMKERSEIAKKVKDKEKK